jgi:hypothetical protein
MQNFITFITVNWPQLVAVLVAVATVGSLIAKLTPTPKDDGIFAAILNFLNLLPAGAKAAREEKKASSDGPTPLL